MLKYAIDSFVFFAIGLAYIVAPAFCVELYAPNADLSAHGAALSQAIMQIMGAACMGMSGFLCIAQTASMHKSAAFMHALFAGVIGYWIQADMVRSWGGDANPLYFWCVYHAGYALCFLTAPPAHSKSKSKGN